MQLPSHAAKLHLKLRDSLLCLRSGLLSMSQLLLSHVCSPAVLVNHVRLQAANISSVSGKSKLQIDVKLCQPELGR